MNYQLFNTAVLEGAMDLREAKIVHDRRIYEEVGVSRDHGKEKLHYLEAKSLISPKRTPTGRCFLSFVEAEILANAL